jgi:hypothetical protein
VGCVYQKLDSAIMVVKAAEDRLRCDGAETLNRAMEWGVLVQRSMSPQLIIIGGICNNRRHMHRGFGAGALHRIRSCDPGIPGGSSR